MDIIGQMLHKDYIRKTGSSNVFTALFETDITLSSGTVTVIHGRSGGGKSTLLNILAGIVTPTSGNVFYDDMDFFSLDDEKRSSFRNRHIGYIPQGTSAVSSLNLRENILLPLALCDDTSIDTKSVKTRADELMKRLDIIGICEAKPSELSGGELRRMAIARALLFSPELLFADEPTGDLDDDNTRLVFDMLKSSASEGSAVLIVTHENDIQGLADKIYRMDAGVLFDE